MSEGDEETRDEYWERHFFSLWCIHFRDNYDDEDGWQRHYRALDRYGPDYPQCGIGPRSRSEYERDEYDHECELQAWWQAFVESAAEEYEDLCRYREENLATHSECLAELEMYASSGEDGPPMDLARLASVVVATIGDTENEGFLADLSSEAISQLTERDRVTDAIHVFLDSIEKLDIPNLDLDEVVAHVAFEVEVRRNRAERISHGRAYLLELDRRGERIWRRRNPGIEPKRCPWREGEMQQIAKTLGLAKDGSKGRLTNVLSKIRARIKKLGPVGVYARAYARESRVRGALSSTKTQQS